MSERSHKIRADREWRFSMDLTPLFRQGEKAVVRCFQHVYFCNA